MGTFVGFTLKLQHRKWSSGPVRVVFHLERTIPPFNLDKDSFMWCQGGHQLSQGNVKAALCRWSLSRRRVTAALHSSVRYESRSGDTPPWGAGTTRRRAKGSVTQLLAGMILQEAWSGIKAPLIPSRRFTMKSILTRPSPAPNTWRLLLCYNDS